MSIDIEKQDDGTFTATIDLDDGTQVTGNGDSELDAAENLFDELEELASDVARARRRVQNWIEDNR